MIGPALEPCSFQRFLARDCPEAGEGLSLCQEDEICPAGSIHRRRIDTADKALGTTSRTVQRIGARPLGPSPRPSPRRLLWIDSP